MEAIESAVHVITVVQLSIKSAAANPIQGGGWVGGAVMRKMLGTT